MNAKYVPWLLAAGAVLCLVPWLSTCARAHSWYSTRQDPVWKNGCCGGTDCNELDGRFVSSEDAGLRIRMTADQARAINPNRNRDVDALVEWDRVQDSEDGKFHICLMTYFHPEDRRHGVWCLFSPPNS